MRKNTQLDKILDEHIKKMNELSSKYPHVPGTLDGGPPKYEVDKIMKETKQKIKKLKEEL